MNCSCKLVKYVHLVVLSACRYLARLVGLCPGESLNLRLRKQATMAASGREYVICDFDNLVASGHKILWRPPAAKVRLYLTTRS